MIAAILIILVIALVGIGVYKSVIIVPQSEAYVVERLGSYHKTLNHGLNILIPFIDRIEAKISLKEMTLDFEPQAVITKDNVTMEIDTVVYLKVVEPKLFAYGAYNPIAATENLTATTLRNIIGNMTLDETLTSRDHINFNMREVIDEATDSWGIYVKRVELKNILTPGDIQNAMEKQMIAERQKREMVLMAQATKEATITRAEGERESMLMLAQTEKESAILKAQGEAEAIKALYEAKVYGMRAIKEAEADDRYIQLEALQTLTKVADGKSTKMIVPSNLQDLSSYLMIGKNSLEKENEQE